MQKLKYFQMVCNKKKESYKRKIGLQWNKQRERENTCHTSRRIRRHCKNNNNNIYVRREQKRGWRKNLTWTSSSSSRRSVKFANGGKSSGFSDVHFDTHGGTFLQAYAQTFSFLIEHCLETRAAQGIGFIHLTPDRHKRQTCRHV